MNHARQWWRAARGRSRRAYRARRLPLIVLVVVGAGLLLFGLFDACYAVAPTHSAVVGTCSTRSAWSGRGTSATTTCSVLLTDGRQVGVELPHPVAAGARVAVRGHGTNVRAAVTVRHELWTLPAGVVLVALAWFVGWLPARPRRRR